MQVQKPGLKKSLLEAGLRQAGAKPGAFIQDAGNLANKQTHSYFLLFVVPAGLF